jgi:hypothetical protein
MNLRKTLLLWTFCLFYQLGFSQDDFKEGFLIDQNKKYIYGYLKKTTPSTTHCTFKESLADQPKEYTPEQIEGYGFLNETPFLSRSIMINGRAEKLFLDVIAEGQIILFTGLARVFIEKEGNFHEINLHAIDKSLLESLLTDCKKVTSKIKNLPNEFEALARLIKNYNACNEKMVTSAGPPEKKTPGIHVELMGGIDRTSLVIDGISTDLGSRSKLTDRTLATGGINLIFYIKNMERLSLQTGAWSSDQRFYANNKITSGTTVQQNQIRINYQGLRIPLLIRVNSLGNEFLQPYCKTGFLIPVSLKSNSLVETESSAGNSIYIDNQALVDSFREPLFLHFSFGTLLKISERFKGFIEINYSSGTRSYEMAAIKNEPSGKFNILNIQAGLRIK